MKWRIKDLLSRAGTSLRSLTFDDRCANLTQLVIFSETSAVLPADKMYAAQEICETLILANECELIDGRDNYCWQIPIYVLVSDVNGKSLLPSRTFGVFAMVLDKPN
jgi:hypothetical protein